MITEAIPNVPFSYRAVWEKNDFANGLGVNKTMVGFYEDILIFSKTYDLEKSHPLINYFMSELELTKMNQSDINNLLGNKMGGHYFTNGFQFAYRQNQITKNCKRLGILKKIIRNKEIDDQFKKTIYKHF